MWQSDLRQSTPSRKKKKEEKTTTNCNSGIQLSQKLEDTTSDFRFLDSKQFRSTWWG